MFNVPIGISFPFVFDGKVYQHYISVPFVSNGKMYIGISILVVSDGKVCKMARSEEPWFSGCGRRFTIDWLWVRTPPPDTVWCKRLLVITLEKELS